MHLLRTSNIPNKSRFLVRCDLDVPIDNGVILEKYRLEAALPTLKLIIEKGAIPVIAGHIGKPEGKVMDKLSTQQLEPYFEETLGKGKFELLENLRFDPGEEKNDPDFAKKLASNANFYVNESFATSHRKHASIVGVAGLLPSYAGLQLEKEVENLNKVMKDPARPFIAIIGGAKIESKLPVITKFLQTADAVLVGGKLGPQWKETVPEKLFLPKDYTQDGKDIGALTVAGYTQILQTAKTVVWAGPMGMYEEEKTIKGTEAIARSLIDSQAFSVIGGGDTIAALNKLGLLNKFNFVSTGGSAMLDFLSEGTLPGLEVLDYHG